MAGATRDRGVVAMGDIEYQVKIQSLLSEADVVLDGDRPWDIKVHNPDIYGRILGAGSLGLGESYMDGWWSCPRLDEFFFRVLNADLANQVTTFKDKVFFTKAFLMNMQKGRKAFRVGTQHYDVGNDLYRHMLDKRMTYTCAYWRDAENLDQAQEHKLELVCRKLKLQPSMRVLDIGCGWGGAARYMARHYDVEVVGISISQEQINLANQLSEGLNVEFRFQDYRDLSDSFDRIFSLGMFEHVGFKNYRRFFHTVNQCLNDDGLFLLHTIGHRKTARKVDPWIARYIFPNSILPSSELISRYSSEFFTLEDWHNFGLDYYRTLMAWHDNIEAAWPELPEYDQRFRRMWRYYLMSCAGAFKSYHNHLWQIVFSKGVQTAPYTAVRSAVD